MKILSFGEVLWDVFGDEKTIGGAPFNFAAHLARLGAESLLVTAVGRDDNGVSAIEEAKRLGIDTRYFSVDRQHQTGVCNVTLSGGKPSYELVADVAYDHIPPVLPSGDFDALYMGTLALRSPDSRRSFESILRYLPRKEVFFDVNFRAKFYTRELVDSLLRETTILKVSDEELPFFGNGDLATICLTLAKRYKKLKYICVTLGADGADVFDCANRTLLCSEKPKSKPISTVGAGDSFSACFLYNILAGEPVTKCLDRAVILSDYVTTKLGAVPEYGRELIF